MRAKLLGLLTLAFVILAVSWVGSRYFAPGVLNLFTNPGQNNSTPGAQTVKVTVLVNFGNGTRLWFNAIVPQTYNYYNVTLQVTNGNMVAVWSSVLSAVYVYKILGYGCKLGDFNCGYWSLWTWNSAEACWAYSPQGVNLLRVTDFRMIAWYFNHYDLSSFPDRCE